MTIADLTNREFASDEWVKILYQPNSHWSKKSKSRPRSLHIYGRDLYISEGTKHFSGEIGGRVCNRRGEPSWNRHQYISQDKVLEISIVTIDYDKSEYLIPKS